MTKNERIKRLEAEVADLRSIIARLATRVAYLEILKDEIKQPDVIGIPWKAPTITEPLYAVTCGSSVSIPWPFPTNVPASNASPIGVTNSTPWPFPTNEFPLKGDVGA